MFSTFEQHTAPTSQRSHGGPITGAALLVAAAILLAAPNAHAQHSSESQRIDLLVTVESPDDSETDEQTRERTREAIAEETVARLERRLEAIGVGHPRLEIDDDLNIRIRVDGSFDPATIEGAIIPSGRLEIRPVLTEADSWLDRSPRLPRDVEFRPEPGSIRIDSFFLYAPSPRSLRSVIADAAVDDGLVEIFPHEEGWRTLRLGEPLATERDVEDVELQQSFSGAPYVDVTLAEGVSRGLTAGFDSEFGRVAVLLDGEVVAVERVSSQRTSEVLGIDPPEHLESTEAQNRWALQVTGRLAAPIPVQLATLPHSHHEE